MEDIVLPLLDQDCPQAEDHEYNHQYCYILSQAGHYFKQLRDLGIWPISKRIYQTSPSIIPAELANFQNYFEDEYGSFECGGGLIDLKQQFMKAVETATLEQRGLCLKCVKQGKVTKDEGNCWAKTELMHVTDMDYTKYDIDE